MTTSRMISFVFVLSFVWLSVGCGDVSVPQDVDGRVVCENSDSVCSVDEMCALVSGQKYRQCYRRCSNDRTCEDAEFCRGYFGFGLCQTGARDPEFVEMCVTPPPTQCLNGDIVTWNPDGEVMSGRCMYEIDTQESCDEGTQCVDAECVPVDAEE